MTWRRGDGWGGRGEGALRSSKEEKTETKKMSLSREGREKGRGTTVVLCSITCGERVYDEAFTVWRR